MLSISHWGMFEMPAAQSHHQSAINYWWMRLREQADEPAPATYRAPDRDPA